MSTTVTTWQSAASEPDSSSLSDNIILPGPTLGSDSEGSSESDEESFSYSIMGAYWSATQESNFNKVEKEDMEKKEEKTTRTQTISEKWTQTTVHTKEKSTQINLGNKRRRDDDDCEEFKEKKWREDCKEEYVGRGGYRRREHEEEQRKRQEERRRKEEKKKRRKRKRRKKKKKKKMKQLEQVMESINKKTTKSSKKK